LVKTNSGYERDELVSALQKCIRRGMEFEAVHFAVELEEFNEEKGSGATALWNRLKVIASEDVGCANPVMPTLIETLHKSYLQYTTTPKGEPKLVKEGEYRLFVVNAVVCLCRSVKSRITDDLLNVVYVERQNGYRLPDIPDFALDMHTARGRAMGRGIDHFFNEGAKLENEAFPNPWKDKAHELLSKHGKPS